MTKAAKISEMILSAYAQTAQGGTAADVRKAVDSVLGEGTYDAIVAGFWDDAQKVAA